MVSLLPAYIYMSCLHLVIKRHKMLKTQFFFSFFKFQSIWTLCSPVQESQDPRQRTEGLLPRWLRRAKTAARAESGWALEPHIRGKSGEVVSRSNIPPSTQESDNIVTAFAVPRKKVCCFAFWKSFNASISVQSSRCMQLHYNIMQHWQKIKVIKWALWWIAHSRNYH